MKQVKMTQEELLATFPSAFMGLPLDHKVSCELDAEGLVRNAWRSPSRTTCGTFDVSFGPPTFCARYFFEGNPVFSVEAETLVMAEVRMIEKLKVLSEKTAAVTPLTLTKEQVKEVMRQGEAIGRELERGFERMERVDPTTAAMRAR